MLSVMKDPAKRAEWVYGQPMAPCPACGSYNKSAMRERPIIGRCDLSALVLSATEVKHVK